MSDAQEVSTDRSNRTDRNLKERAESERAKVNLIKISWVTIWRFNLQTCLQTIISDRTVPEMM